MAIKVNLLRREAPKKAAGIGGLPTLSMPKGVSIGGGAAMKGAMALLGIVVLGLAFLAWQAHSQKLDNQKKITQLKAQRQLVELRVAEAAKREIQRRLDIIGRVAKSQKVPVELMGGVLKSVPQGIWLTSLDVKPQETKVKVDANRPPITYTSETLNRLAEKKEEAAAQAPSAARPPAATKEVTEITGFSVVIKGLAFNNFQVAEFMENLRKAGVFSDVDFTVTQAASVESVRVMDFEVTASVKL
jgi:Tfp pilus assembly protein PilN